ncbi:MAG TPA: endolytic transglycosylase MltG [Bryobacteraceae bacterium]|nr:endolytic transglycosylase MltG [Bryobacteraceae bacterium]
MKTLRFALGLAFLIAAAAYYRTESPYAGFSGRVFVDLPPGASTAAIARSLAEAGVIRSPLDFLLVRALQRGRKLQAGEYAFSHPDTAAGVYRRIARGDIFFFELKVPEGKNMFEIAAEAAKLGLFSEEAFLDAARDPGAIRDLDPRAPTLEGYLFPDTYRINHRTTPGQLCGMMTARFRAAWRGLHTQAGVHDAVTMASLVEKEARLPAERPLIAGVFDNRLRIGMKLDCDPTVIYAALRHEAYRGAIHESDLQREDPYNTYRFAGLPPGPIANPGLAAIRAALEPARSTALYFVLRPDDSGSHEFSAKLNDHKKAVTRYRRGRR